MSYNEIISWLSAGAHNFEKHMAFRYQQALDEYDAAGPENFNAVTRLDAEAVRKKL